MRDRQQVSLRDYPSTTPGQADCTAGLRISTPSRAVGTLLPQVIALAMIPLVLIVGLFNRSIFPDQYFFDSNNIANRLPTGLLGSTNSFDVTAALYRTAGLTDLVTVQVITLSIFLLLLWACVPWRLLPDCGVVTMGLYGYAGITAATYLAQFSKESAVLLIALLVLVAPRGWRGDLLLVAVFVLYAAFVRPYWYLIAGVYIVFRLTLPRMRNLWLVPVVTLGFYVVTAFGTQLFLGHDLGGFREGVAQYRTHSVYASSEMQSYLPGTDPWSASANAFINLVFLILPIPMVLLGGPLYLAFAAACILLWLGLARCAHIAVSRSLLGEDKRALRIFSLLIAMVIVQAIFEPDYGSYTKHLTPLIPLFLWVFARFFRKGWVAGAELGSAGRVGVGGGS